MESTTARERARWNACRFVAGAASGGYESWFQRANHPSRPLAFWIRYTIFSPRDRPADAVGELWAVYFDGEARRVVATKEEHPLGACTFSGRTLDAKIGEARLDVGSLRGAAARGPNAIEWDLRFASEEPPLLLLPARLYAGSFPRAKALVGEPLARFDGTLGIDGVPVRVEGWVGSQNHNWGSEHTAAYAWGQVAGFDDDPDAFLELSTARLRAGPLLAPPMTALVLRVDGEELRFTGISRGLAARARYTPFSWSFETGDRHATVTGSIAAPSWAFVALPYRDPPGGRKTCLNTKIARCDLTVERRGMPRRTLSTSSRAAFEIVGDDLAIDGLTTLPRGIHRRGDVRTERVEAPPVGASARS